MFPVIVSSEKAMWWYLTIWFHVVSLKMYLQPSCYSEPVVGYCAQASQIVFSYLAVFSIKIDPWIKVVSSCLSIIKIPATFAPNDFGSYCWSIAPVERTKWGHPNSVTASSLASYDFSSWWLSQRRLMVKHKCLIL